MPFTPQPTNNTPTTKLTTDTFNALAENDIYLKDATDTNASDISTNASDINTIENNNSTFNGDKTFSSNVTVDGSISPTSTPTEFFVSFTGTPYTVPRGIFSIFYFGGSLNGEIRVQKFIDGGWKEDALTGGGVPNNAHRSIATILISSGTDTRVVLENGTIFGGGLHIIKY
jgi:hypothetical protein